MKEEIDILLRTANGETPSFPLQKNKKYINTKRKINYICKNLCIESNNYDPEKTIKNINEYIDLEEKMDRILYSEISSYIFSLDMKSRGTFATNVEKLLLYALNNNINNDSKKIAVKIYDHFQLALYQIDNANNIFATGIEETKYNLQREIKGVEKEYITILGIFASIVITFVAGITFSTSVLQNLANISIYRILLTTDFLALVFINVIFIFIKFICAINDKECFVKDIVKINKICILFAVLIVVFWLLDIYSFAVFIRKLFPWNN